MSSGQGLSALFWFIAILALVPLVLWLVKRSPMGARLSSGPMRNVAVLPLSPSQRVVTIEVGKGDEKRWLVLGVTPGSINMLYTLSPDEDVHGPIALPTPASGFAQLFDRMKQGGGQRDKS